MSARAQSHRSNPKQWNQPKPRKADQEAERLRPRPGSCQATCVDPFHKIVARRRNQDRSRCFLQRCQGTRRLRHAHDEWVHVSDSHD